MTFCHGNGDPARDGCCWVNGAVCPLRWKLENGHIFDAAGADLGTVEEFIQKTIPSKAGQDQARAQVAGVRIVCRAAIDVLIQDPKRLNNRASFEAAWNAHPEYVEKVRPAWAEIEQRLGLPAGSYQCSTWKGTGRPQCCFAESATENETKAQGLSAAARTVRQAGGR